MVEPALAGRKGHNLWKKCAERVGTDRRREVPVYDGSWIPNKFHHTCVRCSTLFSATMEAARSAANYSEPGSERHCPPDHYQRPRATHTRSDQRPPLSPPALNPSRRRRSARIREAE